MIQKDHLKGTDIVFYQDDKFFKVNTDTTLLGQYIKDLKGKSVLDIGTNTGALLLYAALKGPRSLTGVDVNERALELASYNLKENGIEAELYHSDISKFRHELFDVIICNPPYHQDEKRKEHLDIAKSKGNMPIDVLFDAYRHLLKDNGTIYMIYPARSLYDIFRCCEHYRYKIYRMTIVYNKDKEAIRTLLTLKRGITKEMMIEAPIIIEH